VSHDAHRTAYGYGKGEPASAAAPVGG
jgi:hypothetical protein